MTIAPSPLRAVRLCTAFAALVVSACSGGDGGTAPPKPASVQAVSATISTATVGAALATSPTFTVKDAGGSMLGGITVSVVVSSGGGSLVGAPTKSAAGATPVGTWTLGTTAGPNTLTVNVSGVPPLTITATGTPGAPSKMVVTGGNSQTALAGAQVAIPLEAAVQDQFSNGIPNIQVTFQSTTGGGSVTPATMTTNGSGVATGAVWRLGNKGGPQTATASANGLATSFTATIQTSFPLDLRFFGPPMSAEALLAFTNAANRIRAAIISPVNSVLVQDIDISRCGINGLTGILNESPSRGVIIYAAVAAIDGPGKILAQAGPCFQRDVSKLPVIGVMQFDEADIQNYINSGRFEAVVLHEMNHVVGFGTIWGPFDKNLLTNPAFDANEVATGSLNPRFTGAVAIANCLAAGGTANHCTVATGVAVEMCGGGGTADGHWRELLRADCNATPSAAFDTELMTGFAESTPNMPWSTMSIGSFQDLGYTVNLLAADTYFVPSLLAMARMSLQAEAATDGAREIVHRAKFEVSSGGRVTIIKREKK
ncbi:MAG: leishmanolysin-related zinc metalloendopeptidase [Gemmatimonadota bacterium]